MFLKTTLIHIVKYTLMVAIATIISSLIMIYSLKLDEYTTDYVAGQYGDYCYIEGEENGNIEYVVKFKTLAECTEYVRNNRD